MLLLEEVCDCLNVSGPRRLIGSYIIMRCWSLVGVSVVLLEIVCYSV